MLEFELPCDQCCAVTLVAAVALGCSYEAGGLVVLEVEVEDAGLEVWSLVGLYWLCSCSVLSPVSIWSSCQASIIVVFSMLCLCLVSV